MTEINKESDENSIERDNSSQLSKEFVNALLKFAEAKKIEATKETIDFRFVLLSLGICICGIAIFLSFAGNTLANLVYILSVVLILSPFMDLIQKPPQKAITIKSRESITLFVSLFSDALIFVLSIIFLR